MASTPTDIANLALDAVGRNVELGDISEGSRAGNLCLRAYRKCRQALLRGAPWDFARRQTPLLLLADASGQSPGVRNTVSGSQFQYEYAYPQSCVRVRYIPWNPYQTSPVPSGNIQPSNASSPLTTGGQPAQLWGPIRPTRYVVTNDQSFTTRPGPDGTNQQGQSPIGQTVILSNVQNASCVFTFDAIYPSLWDPMFLDAMIAYMASEISVALWSDQPQLGIQFRNAQIAIAKDKISNARVADGNEMTVGTDHMASWSQARYTGGSSRAWGWGAGPYSEGDWGCWGVGWAGSVGFADGSSY